ncbi:hypothetical protein C9439_07170, partial [archaeon SCG-AAA382B04]
TRLELFQELTEDDPIIIGATDNDEEGEVMLYYLTEKTDLNLDDFKRMRFGELTEEAIVEAYEESLNGAEVDKEMVDSAHLRHLTDCWYGSNIPNLFSKGAVKYGATDNILFSLGRIKIPLLKKLAGENLELLKKPRESKSDPIREGDGEATYSIDVKMDFYGEITLDSFTVDPS